MKKLDINYIKSFPSNILIYYDILDDGELIGDGIVQITHHGGGVPEYSLSLYDNEYEKAYQLAVKELNSDILSQILEQNSDIDLSQEELEQFKEEVNRNNGELYCINDDL